MVSLFSLAAPSMNLLRNSTQHMTGKLEEEEGQPSYENSKTNLSERLYSHEVFCWWREVIFVTNIHE